MNQVHFLLSSIPILILAINVLICVLTRTRFSPFFRWFTYFLISGLVIQIFAQILWYKEINNLHLLHIYTWLEFLFLSLFYRAILKELTLKYFDHFIGLVATFIILNTLFIQPITTFNSISKTITQIIYIIYSLSYFFGLPKRENQFLNLINSAILVYYSGSLFIFMFTSVLSILQDLYKYFWLANALLYLLFQLLVLYGLWKTGLRQMKFSP